MKTEKEIGELFRHMKRWQDMPPERVLGFIDALEWVLHK